MTEKQVRGFAAQSSEKQAKSRAKAVATRRANALKRVEAEKLRKLAYKKKAEYEELLSQADELDGKATSSKVLKKRKADLFAAIEDEYSDSVSSVYLKTMKQHAWKSNLTVEELTTPLHVAMDILHDANANVKEKNDAMKLLSQFEASRPSTNVDENAGQVASIEEEMQNMFSILKGAMPKKRKPLPEGAIS